MYSHQFKQKNDINESELETFMNRQASENWPKCGLGK